MNNIERIRYVLVCLRAWKHFFFYPLFTIQLTIKRLMLTITRKFWGPTIVSPVTGEAIFNVQSLMTYWAFHVVRELGDEWHPILRNTVRPVVFDVGANLGLFGRLVRSVNPASYIVAIDPWQEMEAHNNHATKFYAMAVGDSAGTIQLARARWMLTACRSAGVGESSQSVELKHAGSASNTLHNSQQETWPVKVMTLDDIWCQHGSPDIAVLKIDVDGAEGLILAGAQNMLARTNVIILEVNSPEVLAALPVGFTWVTHNWHDRIGTRTV